MTPYAESQFVDIGDHARIAELRQQGWEVTPIPGYHGVFSMLAWKGEKMEPSKIIEAYRGKLRTVLCEIGELEVQLRFRKSHAELLRHIIKEREKDHEKSKRSRPAKARDKRKAASPKVPKRAVPR